MTSVQYICMLQMFRQHSEPAHCPAGVDKMLYVKYTCAAVCMNTFVLLITQTIHASQQAAFESLPNLFFGK